MGVAFRVNKAAVKQIKERVSRRLEIAAEMVVSEAKRRCPVDTGNLRNSIEWGRDGKQAVIVGTVIRYGVYQELGFIHKHSGRFIQNAFLLPALLAVKDRIGARLA